MLDSEFEEKEIKTPATFTLGQAEIDMVAELAKKHGRNNSEIVRAAIRLVYKQEMATYD